MDPPEHHRDSYVMTNLESVHSQPRFYDRSNISRRRVGLAGVAATALVGVGCICAGIAVLHLSSLPSRGYGNGIVFSGDNGRQHIFSLSLNIIITACTEATGFVHGTALRSALVSEGRLSFNTNLRLLSAASGVFNPNGTLCNTIMAFLLVVSYTSSLLVIVTRGDFYPATTFPVFPIPLLVLGVALFLQAVVAFASVRSANILTWSSSPFDITAALVHHAQILPELGQCMHGVADDRQQGPAKPCTKQSSAWGAHKGVRKVVLTLWLLVIFYVAWGVIIFVFPARLPRDYRVPGSSWSFFPQGISPYLEYWIPLTGATAWIIFYVNMAVIQGPLTLALHCSELAVNLVQDEWVWRKATTKMGTTISSRQPLASVLRSPLKLALLVCKPVLHWMLGLAFDLAVVQPGRTVDVLVAMLPFQIFNYSVALFIFSLALTVIVLHRPSGPQPAAYGHIQTLANLIDEWSPTMWWGHKCAGHAGTSNRRLGEVDMNALYG